MYCVGETDLAKITKLRTQEESAYLNESCIGEVGINNIHSTTLVPTLSNA